MTRPATPLSRLIHHYLVPWNELDWPADWSIVFGRSEPLVLEAGFGNGDFLVDLARRDPTTDFIGIEVAWSSVQRLLRRLDTEGLSNVRVLLGDAGFLLDKLFPACSFREIYVNFSDPWRKSRHHGRRLVQPAFLECVWRRLEPGGAITVATDHAEYAEWIADAFEGQSRLTPVFGKTRVPSIPDRKQTRYETKAREAGLPIHFFIWKRNQPQRPHERTVERANAMPNVTLEGTPSGDRLWPDSTKPEFHKQHGDTAVVIKFTGLYRDADSHGWLIGALVKEGPLTQNFGIIFAPRPEGRYMVKLSTLGSPHPTWGVKQAVRHAAGLILEHQPEIHLVASTVGDPVDTER